MTTAAVTDLKEYLRLVSDLECSVYRQEQIIAQANEELFLRKPRRKVIEKPFNRAEELKAAMPASPKLPEQNSAFAKGIRLIISAALILLGLYFSKDGWFTFGVGLLAIGSFAAAIIAFKSFSDMVKCDAERKADYKAAVKSFTEKKSQILDEISKADQKYKTDMERYNRELSEDEALYQQKLVIAQRNYDEAKNALMKLYGPLQETKQTLKKMYDLDIIFEKYRNMIAMTSIYEYYASGRCDRLEGPDGAYNLFESELRQNLIINRMDVIISRLDQIKDNQYILYKQMTETNNQLMEIKGLTEELVTNTEHIASTVDLTASIASSIASNTRMISATADYIARHS